MDLCWISSLRNSFRLFRSQESDPFLCIELVHLQLFTVRLK